MCYHSWLLKLTLKGYALLGVVVNAYNPSTGEMKAKGLEVQGQARLYKTLTEKQMANKKQKIIVSMGKV